MGQAVGLTKDHMIEQMMAYDVDVSTLKKFVSVKGETYAFLVFNSTEAAEVFLNKVNGRRLSEDIGVEIIYHYVEESEYLPTSVVCGLFIFKFFFSMCTYSPHSKKP